MAVKARPSRRATTTATRLPAPRGGGGGIREFGLAIQCAPAEALAEALYGAAGDAAFWRAQVADLATDPAPGALLARGGLAVHPFVAEHNAAQLRLARIAKMALDVGLDAQRVRLAERQAEPPEVSPGFVAEVLVLLEAAAGVS